MADRETPHCILMGNPCDGFRVIGPFDSREDARDYILFDLSGGQDMWLAELDAPAEADEDEVHEPEDQSQGDVLGLYDERDYRRDKAHEPDGGESGQDRESYSDDQDRESYYVEPDEGEDDPRSGVDGWGQK